MASTIAASTSCLLFLLLVGTQIMSQCTAAEDLLDMVELVGLQYISAEEVHQATAAASHSDSDIPPLRIHPINNIDRDNVAAQNTNASTAKAPSGAIDPDAQTHAGGEGPVSAYAGINSPIQYFHGPVMGQGRPVHVYYAYYGKWDRLRYSNSKTRLTLLTLAQGIGNTGWWKNIESRYTTNKKLGHSPVVYKGSVIYNGYHFGHTITSSQVQHLARNAALSPHFGKKVDPNGVYFVITDNTVTISGLCTKFCGWHTYDKHNMKYAFIGNAATRCPKNCGGPLSIKKSSAPNDWAGDMMASVLAHELMEAHSDPRLNAWHDQKGNENADKCAWTYGKQHFHAGKRYNTHIKGKRFLIQQNWDWFHGDNKNAASSCRITLT
eukprot:jgi/Chlat1/1720/Chrsp129S00098